MIMLPSLIGITGRAGTGKDTLAAHLVSSHGFRRYGLADPIKSLLNSCFDWPMSAWDNRPWKEGPAVFQIGTDADGRDTLVTLSPRQLAQWLGTEVGREIGGHDVWLDRMVREYTDGVDAAVVSCLGDEFRMVVPDIRFPNEARRIQSLGGVVVNLFRGAATPVSAHVSEIPVPDEFIDIHITNDGSVDAMLQDAVLELVIWRVGK